MKAYFNSVLFFSSYSVRQLKLFCTTTKTLKITHVYAQTLLFFLEKYFNFTRVYDTLSSLMFH